MNRSNKHPEGMAKLPPRRTYRRGVVGVLTVALGGWLQTMPLPVDAQIGGAAPASGTMGRSSRPSAGKAASSSVRTPSSANPDNMPIKRPQQTTGDTISHPIPGSGAVAK